MIVRGDWTAHLTACTQHYKEAPLPYAGSGDRTILICVWAILRRCCGILRGHAAEERLREVSSFITTISRDFLKQLTTMQPKADARRENEARVQFGKVFFGRCGCIRSRWRAADAGDIYRHPGAEDRAPANTLYTPKGYTPPTNDHFTTKQAGLSFGVHPRLCDDVVRIVFTS